MRNECQNTVEGSAPSKKKEDMAHRIGAKNVEALTTLGILGHTSWRMMMAIHLDRLVPYHGAQDGAQGMVGE